VDRTQIRLRGRADDCEQRHVHDTGSDRLFLRRPARPLQVQLIARGLVPAEAPPVFAAELCRFSLPVHLPGSRDR
jgi:hypothetical protein